MYMALFWINPQNYWAKNGSEINYFLRGMPLKFSSAGISDFWFLNLKNPKRYLKII